MKKSIKLGFIGIERMWDGISDGVRHMETSIRIVIKIGFLCMESTALSSERSELGL
jgi:hypothetical protein